MDTGEQVLLDQHYPSTLESVDQAESEILKAAEQAGFDEDEQHRIGMAVRECMDDVKVRRIKPSGTEVTLVKNVGPQS